jgi:hypothetical protein
MRPLSKRLRPLILKAARLRARGVGWPTVAQHVNRRASICRRWEVRYRDEWRAAYQAEDRRITEEINVTILMTLTPYLHPQHPDKVRKKTARMLHEWFENWGHVYLVSHPDWERYGPNRGRN